jgi:topoisomerase-4 subunit A
LEEFEEQWHFASLERIFIENRIYRDIEEEETWEGVIRAIGEGLKPHIGHLKRAITEDDIVRLTEIRIKRISKFDIDKAQQKIDSLEDEIGQVKYHLEHLVEFAIAYFERLKKEYGIGKERKTFLRLFDDIEASKVAMRNTKLYVNRKEGFIGTSLKKDEFVTDCSDIDGIICLTAEGKMMVTRVDAKTFIGKDIVHIAIFKKKDKRTIYNLIYRDGKSGSSYIKRFAVTSITRDREYDVTQGKKDSKILYFSANPNGEAEVVTFYLRQVGSIKKLKFEVDFSDILIKGRNVKGNIITKYPVKRIDLKEEGVSTLKPRRIWFDDSVKRLNVDERGELLGEFRGEDRLLIITQDGVSKTIKPELTTRFDDEMIVLEKWVPNKPITAIYWEAEKERYYVKRFVLEIPEREEHFIGDHEKSFLELISTDYIPQAELVFSKIKGKDQKPSEIINLKEFISVKGHKALGNQLTTDKVKQINLIDPIPFEPEVIPVEEIEVKDEETVENESEKNKISEDLKTGKDTSGKSQTNLFEE